MHQRKAISWNQLQGEVLDMSIASEVSSGVKPKRQVSRMLKKLEKKYSLSEGQKRSLSPLKKQSGSEVSMSRVLPKSLLSESIETSLGKAQ